jgi:hypothetical protein
MTPADLTVIERRLRDAYVDAATTVHQRDLRPVAPAPPDPRPGWPGRRPRRPLVPLAAAAAVVLIAIAAFVIPRSLSARSQRQHPSVAANLLPRYMVTIPATGVGLLDVHNAVTGTLTATIKCPLDYLTGGYWYALAAQGPKTFIATEDLSSQLTNGSSYFYRFVIGSHGTVTSIRQVRRVAGTVMAAAATPNGRYIGYLLSTSYGQSYKDDVVLANFRTGKVIASWPIPVNDSVASLSIDADGNALAISAYYYRDPNLFGLEELEHGEIIQWTSVLLPATSGTPIDELPKLLHQAGTLALSPDGTTLYEFLQVGSVTGGVLRDRNPLIFNLAAINPRTGAISSVLHTWRAVWENFQPQLALGPGGAYLMVADGTSLARISAATGQYTALGSMPSLELTPKFQNGQGGGIGPMAW